MSSLDQLIYKRRESKENIHIAGKVVDDFIIAGIPTELENFLNALNRLFKLGKSNEENQLIFWMLNNNAWKPHKRLQAKIPTGY